jgi:urease accessory protein
MEAHQLLMLLQWSDSAFPTGAFAHSGGLETYTQNGAVQTAEALTDLITVKLENAARTDFILVHCAWDAYHADDLAQVVELDTLCHASKLAHEPRQASERVGRRMLDNVLLLHTDAHLSAYRGAVADGRCYGHHSIVYGAACAALGLDARTTLLTFGSGMVANQASAALKLISIGQTQVQQVMGALHPAVIRAVDAALARTLDDFGGFAPGLEIRAMQHEHLFRRLFIS